MRIAVHELLAELIAISEKSAQISRLCRINSSDLFNILIQEKSNESKNPRFLHDFKTFADVLIQEVAKYWLELKFPGLARRVYGEETNQFENKLGESITVQVDPDVQGTTEMLVKILNGNVQTAHSLAQIIYSPGDKSYQSGWGGGGGGHTDLQLEQSEIAIWIDPIDSTSEYINGQWHQFEDDAPGITPHGLHCVTCLFGVFDTKTGFPLIGVLNQPFYKQQPKETRSFSGRFFWGFNINGVCQNNLFQLSSEAVSAQPPKPILVGGKESDHLTDKLNAISRTVYVAGAGYKLLCVILAEADLLVSSSRTTFLWDTCAGHAILRSLGGGIVALDDIMLNQSHQCDLELMQVRYRSKDDEKQPQGYNHSKGLVAYRSKDLIEKTISILKS